MLDAGFWMPPKVRFLRQLNPCLTGKLEKTPRRSSKLTQMKSREIRVNISVIWVICGKTGLGGRIEYPVSSIQKLAGYQVCNTPTLKSAILGWFAAAAIARARISRVRRGSMISSTHSRAAAYLGSIAFS